MKKSVKIFLIIGGIVLALTLLLVLAIIIIGLIILAIFLPLLLKPINKVDSYRNVQVSIITDNELDINNIKYYTVYSGEGNPNNIEISRDNLEFNFTPKENDTTGRVICADKFEQMNLYITGEITGNTKIDDFQVKIKLPESIAYLFYNGYLTIDQDKYSYMIDESDGTMFIVIDYILNGNIEREEDIYYRSIDNYYEFVIKIEFLWGIKFNYQNPGIYFDEDEIGKSQSYYKVKEELHNLSSHLYNYTYVVLDDTDYVVYNIDNEYYVQIDGIYYKANITWENDEIIDITCSSESSEVKPDTPVIQILINVTTI